MKHIYKYAALLAALALMASLFACGKQTPDSGSTDAASSGASSEASGEPAGEAVDPEEYKIDYSKYFDKDGNWIGVKASDYITLPEDYSAIQVPASKINPTKQQVQEAIDNILSSYTEIEQVKDRAIEKDDQVNIDFVGSIGGVEFEGGSTGGNGTTVTAGGKDYIDDFLTQIIGHKPGETFDVNVTFPDPYTQNNALSGKDAVFKVTVNYIEEETTPELTDDFVKEKLSEQYEASTVAELNETVTEQLKKGAQEEFVFNHLLENSIFADKLPQKMIEYQKEDMLYYYASIAAQYNMSLEDFLAGAFNIQDVESLFDEASLASMETYAKQYLIYQAIVDDAGLVADKASMDEYMLDVTGEKDYSDYVETFGENYLKWNCLSYQAYQLLQDGATVK